MTKAKFHIKIDDERGSLNKENGISINIIGDLLKNLYTAIDDGKKLNYTLSNVSGNCYRLDFVSSNQRHETNFVQLHENIKDLNFEQLQPKQKEYANTLNVIFKNKYLLKAFDSKDQKITTIKKINFGKKIKSYYSYKTIYGYLSQVGDKSILSSVKHISIDGYSNQIKIKDGEDIRLNPHYRGQKLRIRIREKKSLNNNRILSAEMVDFDVVNSGKLSQNLQNTGDLQLNILKGKNTIDEVINSLYGIAN